MCMCVCECVCVCVMGVDVRCLHRIPSEYLKKYIICRVYSCLALLISNIASLLLHAFLHGVGVVAENQRPSNCSSGEVKGT